MHFLSQEVNLDIKVPNSWNNYGTLPHNNAAGADIIMGNSVPFPIVTHELVSGLYKKFQSILSVVEKPKGSGRQATREIIKKVSDVIWHSLIRSNYKDRAHLQSLYSYLSGNKLDCFGVAFAVVAGCQLLGYRDVHLAIAEDHAWVVFGNKRLETIEVTWHGKGCEDKRGQDITPGIESGSWLYLGGLAVICDRSMEVTAIVSAINISLTANSDCVEVAELQQKLLWLLYDMGHLQRYPMALGILGELEEVNPTAFATRHITCEHLYREAIQAARKYYKNHHVYPYTCQGNYYNRLLKYREAFASWANAADVIRLYTYNCRDDDEIYKELLDIANEMIPHVMKTESSGHSARSILRDSEVFANLLRFYDGICQWEEDSLTPILHIGWAKPLVNNITKFDYDIRSQVVIKLPEEVQAEEQAAKVAMEDMKTQENQAVEGNNNEKTANKCNLKTREFPTTLADLTAACGVKILNPDFLLQGGDQPFAGVEQNKYKCNNNNNNNLAKHNNNNNHVNESVAKAETNNSKQKVHVGNGKKVATVEEENKPYNNAPPSSNGVLKPKEESVESKGEITTIAEEIVTKTAPPEEEDPFEFMLKRPVITLYSQKMKGLKDLLLAEKLNTHAISLQVTAQSVASRKVRGIDKQGHHTSSSTYATVNVVAAAAGSAAAATGAAAHAGNDGHAIAGAASTASAAVAASVAADFIALSRPKRLRRE